MTGEGFTQELGALNAEPFGPSICFRHILIIGAKTDHSCHTA